MKLSLWLLLLTIQIANAQKLKKADKVALRESYDMLVTISESKKDKVKIDSWTAKYNDVDKSH